MRNVDPRLAAMFAPRPLHEQFLAAGIAAMLGEEETAALLDSFAAPDVDWTQVVAGRPLHNWNGKTREEIEKEAGPEAVAAVAEALEARGLTFPEDAGDTTETDREARREARENNGGGLSNTGAETRTGEGQTDITQADNLADVNPDLPPGGGTPPPADDEGEDDGEGEPGEGEGEAPEAAPSLDTEFAGYPYRELKGKSDTELLAMRNVGQKTIAKIRQFEAENPELAAE